ncbi:MAG: Asp-tRNA(Asn)/Glu-tRNA(Gln) amidotransferase subunit GatA [Candidatus Moranbacteria bacterium]|jgi:aspartyl-tRNA(Asn)/glutamyl-tRNA(Gln) amidotransferase subunit A|nr:Asp-tRNA(Asn)/Glu-tRNA(Gln) amidotransferase subunit GatA [Candidatus Moranbacteria bacterium]MBP9801857.1 Asp-tRNA(Asn)/Glu-tRNA(Gln) amidotransferase subunit GatA [Candidatus Moranbacteria bacterium]
MIRELHTQLKRKEISAVELVERYLQTIETRDTEIQAFLDVRREQALREAEMVDQKISRGEETDLLAGIPGALKDNMCLAGERTTAGSKMLDNYIAPYDATVVERLRGADTVIIGKTNMDEFAMGSSTENSAYQKTKNPLDTERVPGGSSGGSAAAVAADMAVWALGSDTGGSIRQPASFCGLVGLKPTYGRVSRFGLLAMASSLDQIGPLTKTVEDAAIVFSRIAGFDRMDATTAESKGKLFEDFLDMDLRGKKVGIPREYFSESLDKDVRAVALEALERFKSLGISVEEISLPHAAFSLPVYYIIMPAEVSSNLARFDGIKYGLRINDEKNRLAQTGSLLETYLDSRAYGLGAEVKRRIMLGTYTLSAGYYDAYYQKAQKVRQLIRQDFEHAYKKVDFIFSPTAPEAAFQFGAKTDDPLTMYLSDIYTVTANLAGVPAVSFPIGTIEKEGKLLPLGGQLQGKWFDEEGLLALAHQYEQLS